MSTRFWFARPAAIRSATSLAGIASPFLRGLVVGLAAVGVGLAATGVGLVATGAGLAFNVVGLDSARTGVVAVSGLLAPSPVRPVPAGFVAPLPTAGAFCSGVLGTLGLVPFPPAAGLVSTG